MSVTREIRKSRLPKLQVLAEVKRPATTREITLWEFGANPTPKDYAQMKKNYYDGFVTISYNEEGKQAYRITDLGKCHS